MPVKQYYHKMQFISIFRNKQFLDFFETGTS